MSPSTSHGPVLVTGASGFVAGHLGIRFAVDDRRSVEEPGISYRPVEETVLDHNDAWRRLRRPDGYDRVDV